MTHQAERVGVFEFLARVTEGRLPIVVIEPICHNFPIGHAAQRVVRDALRCTLVGDVNTAMPKPVTAHQVMPIRFLFEGSKKFGGVSERRSVRFSDRVVEIHHG